MITAATAEFKIATVAERTGIGVHTLRAWERRYGIPSPGRSSGRQRLYSEEDVARLSRMAALIDTGVAPAQAAARVLAESQEGATIIDGDDADALFSSLAALDERAAGRAWNRLIDRYNAVELVEFCLVPVLRRIGSAWAAGEMSVDQEHFATAFLSSRLTGLARQATPPERPVAVLACPAGEMHDLPLSMAAVLIRYRGVNTLLLGANTPAAAIERAVRQSSAVAVILPAFSQETARAAAEVARSIIAQHPRVAIVVGGPGFTGLDDLPGGVTAAATLTDTADLVRQAAWGRPAGGF